MTRTKRAYNKRPIYGGPGSKGIIISQRLNEWSDTVYHPYMQGCMGHCPHCHKGFIKIVWRNKAIERRHVEQEIAHALSEV